MANATTKQPKRLKLAKSVCDCTRCQEGCTHTPGWFRPGEAEKAAKLLDLSLPAFFRRYLGVNWWEGEHGEPDVFVLAPALIGEKAGSEYPGSPLGTCVFFKGGRCGIHAAKPYDCAHGNPHDPQTPERLEILRAERAHTVSLWKKQQGQIKKLLGRRPVAAAMSFFDVLGLGI